MEINSSPTLVKYRDVMRQCLMLYYPESSPEVLDAAIDYSIQKRIQNANAVLSNSYRRRRVIERDENGNEVQVYKNAEQNLTLQQISDYILSREPIVTAFGTMFKHHGTVPNPLAVVVQSFLDNRTTHKKQMFQFPKGSEQFEKYNLLQSLTKMSRDLWVEKLSVKPI